MCLSFLISIVRCTLRRTIFSTCQWISGNILLIKAWCLSYIMFTILWSYTILLIWIYRSKDNLGYAFANFTNAVGAIKITEILRNYQWGNIQTCKGTFVSKKICEVTWARIQVNSFSRASLSSIPFWCSWYTSAFIVILNLGYLLISRARKIWWQDLSIRISDVINWISCLWFSILLAMVLNLVR